MKAFCHAGFEENSKVFGWNIYYPLAICFMFMALEYVTKRGVGETLYSFLRMECVLCRRNILGYAIARVLYFDRT